MLPRSFDLVLKAIILCGTLSSLQLSIESAATQTSERSPFSLKVHVDLVILNVAVVTYLMLQIRADRQRSDLSRPRGTDTQPAA